MIVKRGLESRHKVVEGYVTIVNRVSYRALWRDMSQLLTGSLKHTQCCGYMSQLLTGSLKAHPVSWMDRWWFVDAHSHLTPTAHQCGFWRMGSNNNNNNVTECFCTLCLCCCTQCVALSVFFRVCTSFDLLRMCYMLWFRRHYKTEWDSARESERE